MEKAIKFTLLLPVAGLLFALLMAAARASRKRASFGQNRSTLLKMAEECERLADQQEQATDLRQERSKRARSLETRLAEKPTSERLHEDGQEQA